MGPHCSVAGHRVNPPGLRIGDCARRRRLFITGRDETQRAATEKNLSDTGYGGYTELVLAPTGVHFAWAADYKTPQRAAIEARGYTIIANVGDQPSDLAGGYAQATFLLPNPFYRIP